ncbi:MAG: HEPN domain-containing protein [Nitrospirae bacterium]|nr:HEPN domain-containing protein [Nitrospirota bacterium]
MNNDISLLIKYRIEQAEESIKEAMLLKNEGMSNRAILNRLYYAMFYSVLALLQSRQMAPSSDLPCRQIR